MFFANLRKLLRPDGSFGEYTIPPHKHLKAEMVPIPALQSRGERPSLDNIDRFRGGRERMEEAENVLKNLGFRVTIGGAFTLSVRGDMSLFEKYFRMRFAEQRRRPFGRALPIYQSFFMPRDSDGSKVAPELNNLIEAALIQRPTIWLAGQALPPGIDYFHLRLPGDVSQVVNADKVHRQGKTGSGVTVAMVDSGFQLAHPYFAERGYDAKVVLAPGASDADKDGEGHGTAMCSNLLAVAPGIKFIGVKLTNEADSNLDASPVEGFKCAVQQKPDIIVLSLAQEDLADEITRQHWTSLPQDLGPLELEIIAAVKSGITVVVAAGNGDVAFPGMMPDVIAVGGAYVDEQLDRQASDVASAFTSQIYTGRRVPDLTGLVGMMSTRAAYLMLPVQPDSTRDQLGALDPFFKDKTLTDDGWAVLSGTSAAAPQIAGVAALLKEKNANLSPADIKAALQKTARKVTKGQANPHSNAGTAVPANHFANGAAGHGLVDAYAAWQIV